MPKKQAKKSIYEKKTPKRRNKQTGLLYRISFRYCKKRKVLCATSNSQSRLPRTPLSRSITTFRFGSGREKSWSRRINQSFQSRRRASSWQCSDPIQSYSRHKLQTTDSNQDQRCNRKLIPPHHPSVQTPLSTNRHTSYQN